MIGSRGEAIILNALFLLSLSNASPCDTTIPGLWYCGGIPSCVGDVYSAVWNETRGPGAITVHPVSGTPGWHTMQGQFSTDNTSLTAVYADIGVNETGAVSPNCSLIRYARDNSTWTSQPPAPAGGKLRIHMVPHTHDDVGEKVESFSMQVFRALGGTPIELEQRKKSLQVPGCLIPHDVAGWCATLLEYYEGGTIVGFNVSQILDEVVKGLVQDARRKFSYVEMAYFFGEWYGRQTAVVQAQVSRLVASGQLTFINGGYSMHDEASPSYIDMLDNTALGNRYIRDTFGPSAL